MRNLGFHCQKCLLIQLRRITLAVLEIHGPRQIRKDIGTINSSRFIFVDERKGLSVTILRSCKIPFLAESCSQADDEACLGMWRSVDLLCQRQCFAEVPVGTLQTITIASYSSEPGKAVR